MLFLMRETMLNVIVVSTKSNQRILTVKMRTNSPCLPYIL
ncbi:hypothetical protein VCHA40P242_30357 [Vibrio chagasii]|nr:hypothetical protein VCHA40P242_30357 [Vibrio chagasii]